MHTRDVGLRTSDDMPEGFVHYYGHATKLGGM